MPELHEWEVRILKGSMKTLLGEEKPAAEQVQGLYLGSIIRGGGTLNC